MPQKPGASIQKRLYCRDFHQQQSFTSRSRLVVIHTEGTIVTTRQTLFAGSVVGFGISCAVLALLWFGVAGVLRGGRIDLMYVFWPSSVMLVRGWCCTVPGIMITASSVVIQLLAVHGTCICYVAGCAARSHIVGVINRRSHNFAPFSSPTAR